MNNLGRSITPFALYNVNACFNKEKEMFVRPE